MSSPFTPSLFPGLRRLRALLAHLAVRGLLVESLPDRGQADQTDGSGQTEFEILVQTNDGVEAQRLAAIRLQNSSAASCSVQLEMSYSLTSRVRRQWPWDSLGQQNTTSDCCVGAARSIVALALAASDRQG